MQCQCIIFCLTLVTLSACRNEKSTLIIKDGYTIKSESKSSTFFDGKTKWYKNDTLCIEKNYSSGILNGSFIHYYPNGKVFDSVVYKNGVMDGFRYLYNEKGVLIYKDYYFYGKKVGPQFYYNDSGTITNYTFCDFENLRVFESTYRGGEKVSLSGEVINFVHYKTSTEGLVGIFIFLFEPPRFSITHSLVVRDSSTKKIDTLFQFNKDRIFIDTLLPELENGKYYQIRARVFDSLVRKEMIYVNEAVFTSQ